MAYLVEDDGRLALRSELGYGPQTQEAAAFFGHLDLLKSVMSRRTPLRLPSPTMDVGDLLRKAGAAGMIITPLVLPERSVDVLVMAAAERDLSDDWLAFAQALGNHVAQAVGLARALAQLSWSEENHRRIVNTANEGITMLDSQRRISLVNPQMCELLGYAEDELVGRSIYPARGSQITISAKVAFRCSSRQRRNSCSIFSSRRSPTSSRSAIQCSSPADLRPAAGHLF
ncbi:MAG: PAS domain S-box protein [Chloroflexota bacterium]